MDDGQLRRQALELRELATELVRKADALVALLDTEGITIPRQGLWTRSKVEQIRSDVQANRGLEAMFALLSRSPDRWITYSSVLDAAGRDDREMRSDLRFLSRLTTKLFGAKTWPFEAEQGPLAPSGRWEMTYRMDPLVAAWWEGRAR